MVIVGHLHRQNARHLAPMRRIDLRESKDNCIRYICCRFKGYERSPARWSPSNGVLYILKRPIHLQVQKPQQQQLHPQQPKRSKVVTEKITNRSSSSDGGSAPGACVVSSHSTNKSGKSTLFWTYVWRSTAVAVLGAGGFGVWYFQLYVSNGSLDGLRRSLIFYSFAIPKYLRYRYYMIVYPDNDELWDALHEETAAGGLQRILNLQGFYIKVGQLAASNIGNAFPPIWQNTMSVLQDQCPYQDFETVVLPTIRSEYEGRFKLEDVFESIEPIPIGSASIGQVHRAILKKRSPDGKQQKVVVKVVYPNVEQQLRGDVRTVKTFAQVAQPVHVPSLEEVEKQFATEFDYVVEAHHLQEVRNNLTRAGFCSDGSSRNGSSDSSNDHSNVCIVPRPYLEYCTKRVLVMEEIEGEKLLVALRKNVAQLAKMKGQTVDEFLNELNEKKLEYEAQNPGCVWTGPSAQEFDKINLALSTKHKLSHWSDWIYHYIIGWFTTSKVATAESRQDVNKNFDDSMSGTSSKPIVLLNQAKLIDDLIYIHGHEVLVDGIFNSDPHPGNILLSKTKNGSQPQLGLIDYGQVKRLSKDKRHLFAKIIIALADDNRDDIVRLMKEAGYSSKYMNPDNIYLYAKVYYDEDNKTLTGGLHVQLFAEHLQSIDPIISLPSEFICASRMSLILRGLAHSLHQSRSLAKAWRPIAERVLHEDL